MRLLYVKPELRYLSQDKIVNDKIVYTCQVCGKQHTELHVHHIEPLRDIITKFLTKYNYTTEYIQS